jgi:purine-binding chemotaxis protein CheW
MNAPKTTAEILKARARELARPVRTDATKGQALEVIEFRLAKERYAIEHAFVREVVTLKEFTPLPCTPPFIPGIMNLRSQILPLIDIKKFFDLPEVGITDLHMVIVVHAGDVELGILADSIAGVQSIPLDVIQASLPTLTGIRSKYLKGVTDQLLVILDVAKILGDPKIVVDEEVLV